MTEPLEEAAWVWAHAQNYDRQQKYDAAASLGEWGIFSLRQIGAIVGLGHSTVQKLVTKTARTGGKFDPACLVPLLEMSKRRRRGEPVEPGEVASMLSAGSGTSPGFAARLGGISETYLRRRSGA